MADCGKGLQQVRDIIAAARKDCSLSEKLQFYDNWATQYEEDVSVVEYKAPHLAALALASVCQLNRESKLVLDVACGTGRAAEELHRCGFNLFHGLDGSAGMLEVAKKKELYQELKQSLLGPKQLPCDSEKYDAVIIVGALSDGNVPVSVLPELLRVTKPVPKVHNDFRWILDPVWRLHEEEGIVSCYTGATFLEEVGGPPKRSTIRKSGQNIHSISILYGLTLREAQHLVLVWVSYGYTDYGGLVCMTARSSIPNLQYKAELEEEMSSLQNKGFWEQVLVQEEEHWMKVTSEREITQESDYIPGVIYIYRKMSAPSIAS
ncbi:methyltransferase-like protein 27 isoform X1 [Rhinoderma darwinii]|uniref:methyltransferase-like protein 27 isoform X1 n=1 Tax=Rhinoderma darwinii TaxID=43563 RepID=UPI003F67F8A1